MSDCDFFRVRLDGTKAPIPYLDLHYVRRDVLHYFDENVGDPIYVLLPRNVYEHDYWKFLSIGFDREWAESARYARLIERGCLALINGITLDILDCASNGLNKTWSERNVTVEEITPYVENYAPTCPTLVDGRRQLLETLSFIDGMSAKDFDKHGELSTFNIAPTAQWFDENIVQDYFRSMAEKWA